MQCPECQAATSPSARFCPKCGTDLGAGDRAAVRSRTPPGAAEAATAGAGDGAATTAGGDPAITDDDVTIRTPPQDTQSDLRACDSCGAPNSRRRELCGRCGADLDSGIIPPRPDPDRERRAWSGDRAVAASAPVRRWPWVAGAGLGVAVVVAVGLTLAGLGPLAGDPSLPEATFDAAGYEGDAQVLLLSDIATRTTLPPSGGEEYEPTLMADDDPETAWNNDGSRFEDGIGETIDLFLEEPAWIHRLVITNGFQRDSDTYAANARIRRAEVTFDGGERVLIRLEDLGLERQAVELPEPRLTTTLRIEVTEAFEGDVHPDLAVSDLLLEGWVADEDDRRVAEERAEIARAAPPTR